MAIGLPGVPDFGHCSKLNGYVGRHIARWQTNVIAVFFSRLRIDKMKCMWERTLSEGKINYEGYEVFVMARQNEMQRCRGPGAGRTGTEMLTEML